MRRRTRVLLLVLTVMTLGGILMRSQLGGVRIETGSFLQVDIGGEYVEAPPDDLLGRLLGGNGNTLLHLLSTLRKAKADTRIAGVIVRIGSLDTGWGKSQDIRDALIDFKRSNKPLIALLEHEATASNREYYVALAADRVYLAPTVTAPLTGLSAQFLFLGGLWDKLDIEMTVEKIREYKTMGDMIINKEMSPAHREMANSLLDSIDSQFVGAISETRHLDPEKVREIIDRPVVSPRDFETAGLSDGTKYIQTLHDEQGGEETPLVSMEEYEGVSGADLGLGVGPKIAVVFGVGAIHRGESGSSVEGPVMGADTISRALHEAAEDPDVKAILFRVDSPGGSALASDLIWRATREAQAKKKPFVVSMSDVAASGGYFVAAGADKIVAQPATITGSIGVVMVRPTINKLLANAGIHSETLTRGKFAYLDDLTVPIDAKGRSKVVAELEHIYAEFIDRVAAGRGLSAPEVDEIGRGRVWTGEQAKAHGLVDELGGFMRALEITKELAGLEREAEVELAFYPRPAGLAVRFSELLGARSQVVLPRRWQRLATMASMPFAEGSFLMMMPETIEVR